MFLRPSPSLSWAPLRLIVNESKNRKKGSFSSLFVCLFAPCRNLHFLGFGLFVLVAFITGCANGWELCCFSLPFFVFWSNVVLQTSSCLNKVLISVCRCHCGYEFLLLFRCWWLSLCLVGWLLSKIKCYLDCRFGATFPKARPSIPTIDSFGPSIHPSINWHNYLNNDTMLKSPLVDDEDMMLLHTDRQTKFPLEILKLMTSRKAWQMSIDAKWNFDRHSPTVQTWFRKLLWQLILDIDWI